MIDEYITTHEEIPSLHKKILSNYTDGKKIVVISRDLNKKYEMIRAVIRKYRRIIFMR